MENPFGHDMGLAISMGPNLKKEVERQLLNDLSYYYIFTGDTSFDWSESCIEGKYLKYMDGSLENFSGIAIYNAEGQLLANGWMDFIYKKDQDQLIIYWEFLDIYIDGIKVEVKTKVGVPEHIKKIVGNK
ncbi:hypothetical protein [Cohnella soli]|uniref:Uncharacterized protein n=1 Tax=Cohnella soli TaxID=425005 RepID=A0ABW0HV55_9BACL